MSARMFGCAALLIAVFGVTAMKAQIVVKNSSSEASRAPAAVEPATLETPTGTLHGTLVVPASKKRIPVVFIIAGSGPTNRDGNTPLLPGANNAYKMLAEQLADQGIASLRVDKRGIGESAKAMVSESELRFDTYVDDAALWVQKLRADKRFSTLTITGHSEGSLIGMIAAKKAAADAYISISGIGRRADQVIHDQLKPQLPPEMMKQSDEALATLAAGQMLKTFPAPLASLFRPSIQPYMISWMRYDPSKEIAKLTIPVLIIQGTTDLQVSVDDAKMLAKADPSARLLIIDGMNHVMKRATADKDQQTKAYSDPALPLDPTLVTETVKFVKKVKKAGKP